MRYYYSTVDEIVLTHSEMFTEDYSQRVLVHFERENDDGGFDFATGYLPECRFHKTYGFSEEELFKLSKYLKNNMFLLWEFAQKGGGEKCLGL